MGNLLLIPNIHMQTKVKNSNNLVPRVFYLRSTVKDPGYEVGTLTGKENSRTAKKTAEDQT